MTGVNEEEIAGASDSLNQSLSLVTLCTSGRLLKPSQKVLEITASLQRPKHTQTKKRKRAPSSQPPTNALPTPKNTQLDRESSILSYTQSTDIKEEDRLDNKSWKKRKIESDILREFHALNTPKQAHRARDYLLDIIGRESKPFPTRLYIENREAELVRVGKIDPSNLVELFHLFISHADLQLIANNTNKNAALQLEKDTCEHTKVRPWRDVSGADIGAYFGALLVIGCDGKKGRLSDYWSTDDHSPAYPLSKYCPRVRFEQISRYLKVNDPSEQLNDETWYRKVEPLSSNFRTACKATVKPPSTVSIDEQLVACKGRSKHILQLKVKKAKKGYKIYTLCFGHYLFDFLYTSKVSKVAESPVPLSVDYEAPNKPIQFSDTERVVLTLTSRLRKDYSDDFTVVLDNFFTTIKLLVELRERRIGAFGTAKKGSGMPQEQILLDKCASRQEDYGLECNSIVSNVNCITFYDMKAVQIMSTVHDTTLETPAWRSSTKRPNASKKKARTSEEEGEELPYPQAIFDYNHRMNGSDLCQQLWNAYTVSDHPHLRSWWPLLWMILDATCSNCLFLCRSRGIPSKELTHLELQKRIGYQLLQNPLSTLRQRRSQIGITGQKPSINQASFIHQWQEIKRRNCVVCKPNPLGRGPGRQRQPMQEITNEATVRIRGPQTSKGCSHCKVALCYTTSCWKAYHDSHTVAG